MRGMAIVQGAGVRQDIASIRIHLAGTDGLELMCKEGVVDVLEQDQTGSE